MRWIKAVGALAATIVLVAGVPVGLLRSVGNPWPAEGVDLMAPMTDGVIVGVLAVIVWIVWAQLMLCFVVEALVAVSARGREISVPAAGPQQQVARVLVGAIVAALAALPTFGGSDALASTVNGAYSLPAVGAADVGAAVYSTEPDAPSESPDSGVENAVVTVQRGDTLWSLAEEHLGDGQEWRSIADLNEGARMVDGTTFTSADLLRPGWELAVPVTLDAGSSSDARDVTVERGDTLSQIALDELGDATAYPRIAKESEHIVQPGGAHLVDPDHIEPGWTLSVPSDRATDEVPRASAPDRREPSEVPTDGTSRSGEAVPEEEPESMRSPKPQAGVESARDGDAGAVTTDTDGLALPSWVLPSLGLGGGALATALLGTLAVARVSRWRSRRPGWVPTAAPLAARQAEASIEVGAALAIVDVDEIDQVLRRMSAAIVATGEPLPALAAVEVSESEIALHLREPYPAPSPWARSEDDRVWFLDRPVELPDVGPDPGQRPSPWPLLVAIGADADAAWLMNLEGHTIAIEGDRTRSRDFARYVAAEVATNPWSRHATVDVVGLESDLGRLNPERVSCSLSVEEAERLAREAATRSAGRLESGADTHTARHENSDPDTWPAHLLIIDELAEAASVDELMAFVANERARAGVALLLANSDGATTPSLRLKIDHEGTLRVASADLELVAVRLTADEADAFGQLLEHLEAGKESRPADLAGEEPWTDFATTTGSLRDEYRSPRDAAPEASQLPEPNESYLEAAATTVTDLEELAPAVVPEISEAVLAADPTLDADLAEWFADQTPRPRLTLLGPVWLRASGTALAKRRPYYTELAAYLLLREHGATTDEVAAAFDISPDRARTDVNVLRKWLGIDPDGERYLPDAREAPAAKLRGTGVYQVVDALTDLDLLRRLRIRAEARGSDGLEDLETALNLVIGRPFSQLRPGGWGWLFEGDRIDQHAAVAAGDISHLLVTAHLQQGRVSAARAAVERVLNAVPDDDVTRLDLAAVLEMEGRESAAAGLIHDQVDNRSGDDDPPLELEDRTVQIAERHDWNRRRAV